MPKCAIPTLNKLSMTWTYWTGKHTSCEIFLKPFPKQHILDSSKLKEFADKNSKFDENGRRFSNSVENTVEKGGIAHFEQFLLFQQCFQKTFTPYT